MRARQRPSVAVSLQAPVADGQDRREAGPRRGRRGASSTGLARRVAGRSAYTVPLPAYETTSRLPAASKARFTGESGASATVVSRRSAADQRWIRCQRASTK